MWWLMPVILATWEIEIRRMVVADHSLRSSLGNLVRSTPIPINKLGRVVGAYHLSLTSKLVQA
jgi:hypothetical protein